MLLHQSRYYYCESSASGIYLRVASDFLDFASASRHRVWSPPSRGPVAHNLWAPELHFIDGRFYIYFAADDGDNPNHRMWVLAAQTSDPLGDYELVGMLDCGGWAIDGTTFVDQLGARYFVWSGWPGATDGRQNLYIARMKSPVEIDGNPVLLAAPQHEWESRGMPICEGPQILQRNGRTFLVYSASGSWTEHYCLGLIEHLGGDMLDAATWWKHDCAFRPNDAGYGIGHCGFTQDRDGRDWLIYHAKTTRRSGWVDREVRAQPFSWSMAGLPEFGEPLSCGTTLPVRTRSRRSRAKMSYNV